MCRIYVLVCIHECLVACRCIVTTVYQVLIVCMYIVYYIIIIYINLSPFLLAVMDMVKIVRQHSYVKIRLVPT
jgi:hypothetical protein